MTTGDGFMIIYSITDDKTLAEVSTIHGKLSLLHDNKKVPGIIPNVQYTLTSTFVLFFGSSS
jgi:hypothetical protein